MEFVSRYDTSFLTYIGRKYHKIFKNFDSYRLFVYESVVSNNVERFYSILEIDLEEYCDWQKDNKYGCSKKS